MADESPEAVVADASPEADGRRAGRGALAVILIVLGVLFAVLYRIDNSGENHSYSAGGKAPSYVQLTAGKQYEISARGGMKALIAAGGSAGSLNCSYTPSDGNTTSHLDTTALAADTRATHTLATFIAPVSGMVRVECRALAVTYIDDADNVSGDPAGLFLLLCTISLSVGAMFGLSSLYWRPRRPLIAAPTAEEPRP